MRDRTSSSEREDTGLGPEVLVLEGVGEPVRYDRWFVFPNLAARASGDGRIAQRGWRMDIIRWMSVLTLILSDMTEAVRECECGEVF